MLLSKRIQREVKIGVIHTKYKQYESMVYDIVYSLESQYSFLYNHRDDLLQIGRLAICNALPNYRSDKGASEATYVYNAILYEVKRYLYKDILGYRKYPRSSEEEDDKLHMYYLEDMSTEEEPWEDKWEGSIDNLKTLLGKFKFNKREQRYLNAILSNNLGSIKNREERRLAKEGVIKRILNN